MVVVLLLRWVRREWTLAFAVERAARIEGMGVEMGRMWEEVGRTRMWRRRIFCMRWRRRDGVGRRRCRLLEIWEWNMTILMICSLSLLMLELRTWSAPRIPLSERVDEEEGAPSILASTKCLALGGGMVSERATFFF
jgi:hypothetical protein